MGEAARASKPGEVKEHKAVAWRRWTPWVLVALATIIALVAALNVWVKRQALDDHNWANASSRLLANDDVRNALSIYLVNQLYDNVDVPATLAQRLPPRVKPLAVPLAATLEQAAVRVADDLLARPRIQELWKRANLRAHQLFMDVINGKHNLLQNTNGDVVLNVRPIIDALAARTGIGQRIQQRLPPDAGQLVIMKGNQISAARKSVKVIRVLSYFLFFLVIALYGLAIYLARGRRRTLLFGVGVGVLIVGLIVLVVRRLAGDYLVEALTSNDTGKRAGNAAWAIGTELLRNVGFNAVIYGLAVIFAAWIAGPSRPATWIRRSLAPTMADHPIVIYGAVGVVLLLILLAGPTDAQRIYPLLILFALAFVGTEVLRRQTLREFPQRA